jgi:hypothetical protein
MMHHILQLLDENIPELDEAGGIIINTVFHAAMVLESDGPDSGTPGSWAFSITFSRSG